MNCKPDILCGDSVELTDISFTGLISSADYIRLAVGIPSDVPTAPNYVPDSQLLAIIDRKKDEILGETQRLMAEQCIQWRTARDASREKISALNKKLAARKEEIERKVEAAVEQMLSANNPDPRSSEYMDEIRVPLMASAVGTHDGVNPKLHYGMIPEPYLPIKMVVMVATGSERWRYVHDEGLFDTVETSPFSVYRYLLKGRYIYVANNGADLTHAFVFAIDRSRVEDHVRKSMAFTEDLEVEIELATASAELTVIENQCLKTADEFAAPMILQANSSILQEAMAEVEATSREFSRLDSFRGQ